MSSSSRPEVRVSVARAGMVCVAVVASLHCARTESATQARRVSSAPPGAGKLHAPVDVEGWLGQADAELTLRFFEAVTDVSVSVYGTDGLQVDRGQRSLEIPRATPRQPVTLRLEYSQPQGRQGNLVVGVGCRSAGRVRTRVMSFTVGEQTADPRLRAKARDAGVTIIDGRRVRLLPSRP